MSTTLAVLRLPTSSDPNSLLMTSSTPSSMMTPQTTSSLLASLDPVLVDFWSGFPCPPPWNEGLLFRVNWTSCVSQTVGERIRWFLADRCNIPHNGSLPFPDPDGGGDRTSPGPGGGGGIGDYDEGSEVCDMSCKILVGLFCCLFVIGVLVGGICLLHRRRSQKGKDPRGSQQLSTGSGGERGRTQYAGIHYASASVITREGERPLPPCPEGEEDSPHPLPRQLHSYIYNPRHNDNHQGPGGNGGEPRSFHLHLCPMNSRAAYRAMEPGNPDSQDNGEDLPHLYDYISDTDSVRYRGSSIHDYTYCTCDHSEGANSSVAAECNSAMTTPRQSEGYYSDHDHANKQQHEISKPYPRYPDKSGGSKPFAGEAGLNNNNINNPHEGGTVPGGHRDSVFVDTGRRRMGHLAGQRSHPHGPVDSTHRPVVPVGPTTHANLHPGPIMNHSSLSRDPASPPSLPVDSTSHGPFPITSTTLPNFPRDRDQRGVPVGPSHRVDKTQTCLPAGRNPEVSFPTNTSRDPLPRTNSYEVPVDRIPPNAPAERSHIPVQGINSYETPVERILPGAPVDRPPAPIPVDRSPANIPVDRPHIPLQSMNSYEVPVNPPTHMPHPSNNTSRGGASGSGGGGLAPDGRSGGTLRFENAPQEDWDSSIADGSTTMTDSQDYNQYPHNSPDQAAQRTNALAIHPQYFADYFDANTSSV